MNFTLTLFYLFSFVLLSSAFVVVSTRNTVHGVMFLVLSFINAAALFVILGAEFLAMLLIIVYVGAIAVLFLFVVMMLNVDRIDTLKKEIDRKKPVLILVSLILFAEIFLITKFSDVKAYDVKSLFPIPTNIPNSKAIGNVLYTDFILPFQLAGAVLFVAMIGAIVLTMKEETRFIKKQKIVDQVLRNRNNSLEVVKVKSGEGIDI